MGSITEHNQFPANYIYHFFSRKAEWQSNIDYREESLKAEAYIVRDLIMGLTEPDLKKFLEDIFTENMQNLRYIFPYVENKEVIFWAFKWMDIAPVAARQKVAALLIEMHRSACKKKYSNYGKMINNLHGILDKYAINLSEDDVRSVYYDLSIDEQTKLQVLILVARQSTKYVKFWNEVEEQVENTDLLLLPALLELHLSSKNTEGLEKAMTLLYHIDSRFDSLDESYHPYFRYYIEEVLYRIYGSVRTNELVKQANELEKKLAKYSDKACGLIIRIKQEPALSRIIGVYNESKASDPIQDLHFKKVPGELKKKLNAIGQSADNESFQ